MEKGIFFNWNIYGCCVVSILILSISVLRKLWRHSCLFPNLCKFYFSQTPGDTCKHCEKSLKYNTPIDELKLRIKEVNRKRRRLAKELDEALTLNCNNDTRWEIKLSKTNKKLRNMSHDNMTLSKQLQKRNTQLKKLLIMMGRSEKFVITNKH